MTLSQGSPPSLDPWAEPVHIGLEEDADFALEKIGLFLGAQGGKGSPVISVGCGAWHMRWHLLT